MSTSSPPREPHSRSGVSSSNGNESLEVKKQSQVRLAPATPKSISSALSISPASSPSTVLKNSSTVLKDSSTASKDSSTVLKDSSTASKNQSTASSTPLATTTATTTEIPSKSATSLPKATTTTLSKSASSTPSATTTEIPPKSATSLPTATPSTSSKSAPSLSTATPSTSSKSATSTTATTTEIPSKSTTSANPSTTTTANPSTTTTATTTEIPSKSATSLSTPSTSSKSTSATTTAPSTSSKSPSSNSSTTPSAPASSSARSHSASSPSPASPPSKISPPPSSSDQSARAHPQFIDSLDARIIQYIYAITKLRAISASIKKISSATNLPQSNQLALLHYIILQTGHIFAINEQAFVARLNLLSNFKLFKPQPVTISPIVTHVPYDNSDLPVTPLDGLPSVSVANKCLKLLDFLCNNCISGYAKRLQKATHDRNNQDYINTLHRLVSKELFLPQLKDIDLSLGITEHPASSQSSNNDSDKDDDVSRITLTSPFLFDVPQPGSNLLNDGDFVEATLIDMDIRFVLSFSKHIRSSIDRAKDQIFVFKSLKQLSSSSQETYLKTIPNYHYSLHTILMWTYRINDLYSILRKVGRKIYLSNYDHLYDQKFSFYSKNLIYFRSNSLNDINDLFNTTKKNGVLIANLTRFIRANALHQINPKTILDFSNFLNQSLVMMESSVKKFNDFGMAWAKAELQFRKAYGLPISSLIKIYEAYRPVEKGQVAVSSQADHITVEKSKSRSQVNKLKKSESETSSSQLGSSSSSRSSSVSSSGGLPASVLTLRQNKNFSQHPTRQLSVSSNSSLSSPRRNSVIGLSSVVARQNPSTLERPNSMMSLNSNDSFHDASSGESTRQSTFPPSNGAAANDAVTTDHKVGNRRRSNSQPISSNEVVTAHLDLGAGAAAAALRNNYQLKQLSKSPSNSSSSSLRSPSGSIKNPSPATPTSSSTGVRRSSSLSKISSSSQGHRPPDGGKPQAQPLIVVQETDEDAATPHASPSASSGTPQQASVAPKLTANQRLQQHLKQGAKSGTLMTQQKEQFSSVVFDPNSPSSVNLRRNAQSPTNQTELQPPVVVSPSASPSRAEPAAPKPRTRDQVTKLNTKRNSETNLPSSFFESGSNTTTGSDAKLSSTPSDVSSSVSSSDEQPHKSAATIVFKKVRFTGVPEYTDEEDAPTKYANRILKNFANFRTSTMVNKPAFRKKDQMLKKEESLLFKHNLRATANNGKDGYTLVHDSSPTGAEASTGSPRSPAISAAAALVDKTSSSPFSRPLGNSKLSKLKNKFM